MLDALMTLLRTLRHPTAPSEVNRALTERQDAVEARLDAEARRKRLQYRVDGMNHCG